MPHCGFCFDALGPDEGSRCPCGRWFCGYHHCDDCGLDVSYTSAADLNRADAQERRRARRRAWRARAAKRARVRRAWRARVAKRARANRHARSRAGGSDESDIVVVPFEDYDAE